jgi:hypothetical protein
MSLSGEHAQTKKEHQDMLWKYFFRLAYVCHFIMSHLNGATVKCSLSSAIAPFDLKYETSAKRRI